ncbi:beta-galactosidase [Adhaeribacter aquaticus]|uniref:beta-galactosidase n=1 Tax=Adhaeribacter aquaticus TaxID=299567 RepID=UPI000422986D|nr:beta-galactosidase [Adhaeribacter aquaticus]
MLKKLLFALALLATIKSYSQTAQRFFSKEKLTQTGVYYYPEHWPETQWERDIKNIAKLGFEYIHMSEFAWAFMEPEEGKYDFRWLDKVIDLAGKNNLKVVLCTPTPTPPAWLVTKHPEVFLQNNIYQPMEHLSRGNYSTSSDIYKEYTEKIVTQLAKRYGKDNRVMGWQLDNEPARDIDFSPAAQEKFREWLKKKYGTIDALNKAWGAAFWSNMYNNFDQVRIPNQRLLYGVSPHALLDSKRFSVEQLAASLDFQAQTLRRYISEKQWIMTNYMTIGNNVGYDPSRTKHLDFTSYTNYPAAGYNDNGSKSFRMGSMTPLTFSNDYHRSVKGVYGVMELQPGQVNWGPINPQPEPGAVHMWLWHTFAGGTSLNCTYRYRQPLYGSELYHYGIVGTDGVTPSRGGLEFAQYITEVNKLRKQYNAKKAAPQKYVARKTAILSTMDNLWDQDLQKQTTQWNPFEHLMKYLRIAKALGAPVDFVREDADFSNYKVLMVPAYQLVDQAIITKIQKFAENGGQVILTCRTGHKDKNGHLWEAKWAEPIYKLIGAEVQFFDLMMPNTEGKISMAGTEYNWNNWGDILKPFAGTESLAKYTNQFYAGQTAVTKVKQGKGTVTYIGVDTDTGDLEKAAVRKVYADAGIATEDYPAGINVEYRDGFWVAVNYTSQPFNLNLPANAKILVGEKVLPSPGVTVWTE